MTGGYAEAAAAFIAADGGGWSGLPFFRGGSAARIAARLDAAAAKGAPILPPPGDVFAALASGTPADVRVVILGQDPYPTPGDAHGLAFSVRPGVRIPRSLANVFRELHDDLGHPPPRSGDLTPWARQGVLLLNACLTVEAGAAGAHRGWGWEQLADEVVSAVSDRSPAAVFMLWGTDAQKRRPLLDEARHLVIAAAHPSPLSARRGFFGSRPFSRADAWLAARGRKAVDWTPQTP